MIFQKSRPKAETLASGMSSVVGLGSEHLHLNGVPKIFFNVVLGQWLEIKLKKLILNQLSREIRKVNNGIENIKIFCSCCIHFFLVYGDSSVRYGEE